MTTFWLRHLLAASLALVTTAAANAQSGNDSFYLVCNNYPDISGEAYVWRVSTSLNEIQTGIGSRSGQTFTGVVASDTQISAWGRRENSEPQNVVINRITGEARISFRLSEAEKPNFWDERRNRMGFAAEEEVWFAADYTCRRQYRQF